ncbi:glycosyltransferase family 4 protein [Acidaminobacter hydrogenoformans]|uniref:Glycosyltransferase involved in cell wall bisynthesis n=1 Tax=Acidaminobacter hydrogenoformans DSM 2784 TaxID=1120920 RepID=A0A1G5RPN9_9FIRM|nr:glycosyltransferase family 4 protein [Acidaminobacter hydrogenoformans]SCZ76083.1 Glycosyltransferase involved in cell wall bisynthesis [Acidaminobacter hydrogenoformans DSM 2784]
MKRVILFIPTLTTGGAEKFVVDLAVYLDPEKYQVYVGAVSGIFPEGVTPNRFLSVLNEHQIEIVDLKGDNKLHTAGNIYRLFRAKRPDIVHANLNSLLYIMFFAAAFATETRIFTFHNVASLSGQGFKKLLHSVAFKILKFKPVAICEFVRSTISTDYKIPFDKITCIYNGVDTQLFQAKFRSNPKAEVEFVTTGILYQIKNHKLMIEAFAKAEVHHPNIHLTIIGDGELRRELELQISGYGLQNKIHILGISDSVANYLNKADIYVMSSDTEGLPLSVLEAMACELPIITTKAGGVVDIVKDGINGLLSPVGDVEALSQSMIKLIENVELRQEMGKASRKRALELDIMKCVKQYEKLYDGDDAHVNIEQSGPIG